MPPTINDIAREAHVSKSVVSKVINEKPDVAQETRELVQGVIDRLGYVPSVQARNLSLGTTNDIALVLPSDNYAYMRLVFTVYRILSGKGYSVSFHVTDHDPERERRIFQTIRANSLCGLIHMVAADGSAATEDAVRALKLPTVIVGEDGGSAYRDFERVFCSEEDMTLALAGVIRAKAYHRVVCLCLPEERQYQRRRNAFMREALLCSGYKTENIDFRNAAEISPDEGERLAREALCHEDASAVCSLSNVLSAGILRVLEHDRRQTERLFTLGDMSVYTGLGIGGYSVFLPIDTLAGEATRLLLERLKGSRTECATVRLAPWISGGVENPPGLSGW